ncbi:MAG TPA: OmpH family outer membrane protein [Stellaceae bacterium]|nr:OmpH family outer membrane protein [Stellaceae bacterium]
MAAALSFALAAAPAAAQAPLTPPTVIVVDMTQIMRDAKAAKDIQSQIETEMNAYSNQVSQKEAALKTMRDDLERQRTALAPDVFNVRSQEYQEQYASLDRDVQAKRQEMQQTYSEAMTKVENSALQIIAQLAKERKADMVVAKAALLYMNDGLDLTAEVTKRLDAKLPTMTVDLKKPPDTVAQQPEGAAPAK